MFLYKAKKYACARIKTISIVKEISRTVNTVINILRSSSFTVSTDTMYPVIVTFFKNPVTFQIDSPIFYLNVTDSTGI